MNSKLTFNCQNFSFVPGERLIKAGMKTSARMLRKCGGDAELFKYYNDCLRGDGVTLQQSLSSLKIEKVKNCCRYRAQNYG